MVCPDTRVGWPHNNVKEEKNMVNRQKGGLFVPNPSIDFSGGTDKVSKDGAENLTRPSSEPTKSSVAVDPFEIDDNEGIHTIVSR